MELSLTIDDVTVSTSIHGLEDREEITTNSLINSLVHLASSIGIDPGQPVLFAKQEDGMRLIEYINNYIALSVDSVTEADLEMISETLKTKLITE